MKTFTSIKNLLSYTTKIATGESHFTYLLEFYNDSIKTICNINGGSWAFLKTRYSFASVAGQDTYTLPVNIRSVISVSYTSGDSTYPLTPILDENTWENIISTASTSDSPSCYRVIKGLNNIKIQFPDDFSSTNITINVTGRLTHKDLSVDDYTTGTVTATINSAEIVGAGTTFTSAMVGRYIKLPNGLWYLITAFTDTTHITINVNYPNATTSGATYIIGEVSVLPEAYQMAPIYRAMALYKSINDPATPSVAKVWWNLYDGGYEIGDTRVYGGLIGQMIENENKEIDTNYLSPYGAGKELGLMDPPDYFNL